MNIAAKVAADKREHPDDFCSVKGCLWRIFTARGVSPCRNHPSGAERVAASAGNREDSSPRDVGRGASIPAATLAERRETYLRNTDHSRCQCRKCGGTSEL